MKKHKFSIQLFGLSVLILSFIACDKDFINLESDVITADNATNFDLDSLNYDVITYTQPLDAVQTNGLDVNGLGIYNDSYGKTTANFLTQLTLSEIEPDFGQEVQVDSVVLYLPFFAALTQIDEQGNPTYELDSVFNTNPIELRIFENTYFLRDFDPSGNFEDGQAYFSDGSASNSEIIPQTALEGEELIFLSGSQTSHSDSNIVEISNRELILEETDINDPDAEPQVTQRLSPGIRIKLDPQFWQDKIMSTLATPALTSQSNFNNYFRGLYFKTGLVNSAGSGSYVILNTQSANANLTIFYSRLAESDGNSGSDMRERATYSFGFGPQRINILENDFITPIPEGDPQFGDEQLFIKGGEGAIARIKLFNGENIDDSPEINTFEEFRNFFVEEDEDGELTSKRLINEANLVFFVDQDMVGNVEPDRLYVYDIDNKIPLADFNLDVTNNSIPSLSKITHLGPLQRVDDEPNGDGIKYKLRITNHILNLLLNEAPNVELGLAVSLNVNSENPAVNPTQQLVLTGDDSEFMVPISSVMSPKGTVLHGNATQDESKRVFLEIFYAEPNN